MKLEHDLAAFVSLWQHEHYPDDIYLRSASSLAQWNYQTVAALINRAIWTAL
jgi:hypothetical protein